MKCRRARKLVFDFVDGLISDQDRIVLEQHLADCSSCEEMASGMTRSLDLLHRLPPVEPDDNFAWKVRLRLARERNTLAGQLDSNRGLIRSWNVRFTVSALATFVAVLAAGYVLVRSPMVTTHLTSRSSTTGFGATEHRTEGSLDLDPSVANRSDQPLGDVPMDRFRLTPVTTAPTGDRGSRTGLFEELSQPTQSYDPDSLTGQLLRDKSYQLQVLKQQVQMLHEELRDCEREQPAGKSR